jgi:selenocysteine lyase/cysteine desulfurase
MMGNHPSFDEPQREQIRAEFPYLGSRVYMNYASVGPLPLRARTAIDRINDTLQRLDTNFDPETDQALARARAATAKLIGGRPQQIGLFPNTSFGINWAFALLALQPGDAIVITDHEFPALRYAARHLTRFGIEVISVPVDPHGGLEAQTLATVLEAHPSVKVVAISWVNFHNGFRHDLSALAQITHAYGAYLVVDGIQGVGTRPLNVQAEQVDILAGATHKWLLCPVGLAFVWCHPHLIERFTSPWAGWMSIDWQSEYEDLFGPERPFTRGPRAAEVGTANFAGVRALAQTAEWLCELGLERIERHTQELLEHLDADLDRERFEAVSDRSLAHRSSIYCLRPKRGQAVDLRRHLTRHGIVAVVREGAVRLSPHFPTERSDVEQLVQSLREFEPA